MLVKLTKHSFGRKYISDFIFSKPKSEQRKSDERSVLDFCRSCQKKNNCKTKTAIISEEFSRLSDRTNRVVLVLDYQ